MRMGSDSGSFVDVGVVGEDAYLRFIFPRGAEDAVFLEVHTSDSDVQSFVIRRADFKEVLYHALI